LDRRNNGIEASYLFQLSRRKEGRHKEEVGVKKKNELKVRVENNNGSLLI
jgi:hypothetical protein